MASTFTSPAVDGSDRAFKTLGGVFARTTSYELTGALVVDDVIQAIPVFAGETVLQVEVRVPELDTGADAILLDVGDGADDDRFLAADTVGQAGGLVSCGLVLPYQYAADDTVDVSVNTAPGTGATSGTITVTALIQGG
jgi:hypothetical protein